MPRALALAYAAKLDAAAAAGDIRARDYVDVCWLTFRQHLERALLSLPKELQDLPIASPVEPPKSKG